MKKTILSSLVTTTLLSSSLLAAIDAEVGMGVWKPSLSGTVQYGSSNPTEINFSDLGLEDKTETSNNYIYADFAHIVPMVPNLRVERLQYTINGSSSISKTFKFGDSSFTQGLATKSQIDMKQTDFILYWGIPFINAATLGSLDVNFGLDAKKYDGSIEINNEKAVFDETLPLLYLNTRIDIPATPLRIEGTIKRISYDGASVSDNEAKISYTLPIPAPLIDFNLDLGYKSQNITIPESLVDNLDIDIDTSGMFFGLNARF